MKIKPKHHLEVLRFINNKLTIKENKIMHRIEIIKEGSNHHFIIPTDWNEVTVSQYIGLFDMPADLNSLEQVAWTMRYLTNIPQEDLLAMQMSEINRLARELDYLHSSAPIGVAEIVEAGGWRWRRRSSWDNITYGEVVSLQTIGSESMLKTLPRLLCILLERIDDEDNIIPFTTEAVTAESDFGRLPITKVMGVLEGFLNGPDL